MIQRSMDVSETRSHKGQWLLIEPSNLWADVLKRWLNREQTVAITVLVEASPKTGFADTAA